MALKIHHIGYLVKKIDSAVISFEKLGFEMTKAPVYDEGREVNICFMEKDGCRVELVSPASEASVVSGLIKKLKNSPYHICYESDDFEKDLTTLVSDGFMAIGGKAPAPALGGRNVIFLTSPAIGMLELLET